MKPPQSPPWKVIVAHAQKLSKTAEENLGAAAREFGVAGKIEDLKNTLRDILTVSGTIRSCMNELIQKGLTLDIISDGLGLVFYYILEYLKKTFPPLDQAPGHGERQQMVGNILDKAEQGLLDFVCKHGMSQGGKESLLSSFRRLRPFVEGLVVITGDLIEQHPVLSATLIVWVTASLIAQWWLLRPLLSLMGFGPYGPIKGSPAAWVQSRFWGAAVGEDSWFAVLQRAGMKGSLAGKPLSTHL